MADVPVHTTRWQRKEDETFRVRFRLREDNEKHFLVMVDEGIVVDGNTVEHWVEFKMWDYDTMVRLRRLATKYYQESGFFHVDQDTFNEVKIKNLLRGWSFGEMDPFMRLHHVNGVLTDESFKAFSKLYPNVAVAIINQMNKVLEGTGD